MATNSNLQGSTGTTLAEVVQAVNNLYAALRSGMPPLDAVGAPSDGIVDLGGPLNRYNAIHAVSINIGSVVLDTSFLATIAGMSNVVLDPARTGASGLDLRAAGLVPADARSAIVSGRSGANGSGGGGGGGGSALWFAPRQGLVSRAGATAGGGGGGGVSFAEFSQFPISFSASDPLTAIVGGGGTGGAGGGVNSDGANGGAGAITQIIVGTTTYSFPPGSLAMGGAAGGNAATELRTETDSSGETSTEIQIRYGIGGSGGAGGAGAQSGMTGLVSTDQDAVEQSGLAGGSGGMGGQGSMSSGGDGGRGARLAAGDPPTGTGAASGTAGSDGTDGTMTILFSGAEI